MSIAYACTYMCMYIGCSQEHTCTLYIYIVYEHLHVHVEGEHAYVHVRTCICYINYTKHVHV